MEQEMIFPELSEREIAGAAISKEAAKEGMVLLFNSFLYTLSRKGN